MGLCGWLVAGAGFLSFVGAGVKGCSGLRALGSEICQSCVGCEIARLGLCLLLEGRAQRTEESGPRGL